MLRPVLALCAVLWPALAAFAGSPQVMIEARITEVVRLDFDLGFKLDCDHEVDFDISNPLLQAVNVPATTRKQRFEFEVLGFGNTTVTANFTGAGGGCVGSGSSSLDVALSPLLSDEIKAFVKQGRGLAKNGKLLKKLELAAVREEFDGILEDFEDGLLSLNGAISALVGVAAESQAYVAAQLAGDLSSYADGGGSLLASAGALLLPRAFQTGAKGSAWQAALGSSRDCYADFAADLQAELCDALDFLAELDSGAGLRSTAKLSRRFPLFVAGPRLADDPDDEPVAPPGWLNLVGWKSASGSGLVGTGFGRSNGSANAMIRAIGPGARDESMTLPFTAAARQGLILFVTPQIVSTAPFSSSPFGETLTPVSGNWRLELRYEADVNPADIVAITSP